jgi:large subunit ribosomal protein L30
MSKRLRIRQTRSVIGRERSQRLTLEALGIRRLNQVVEHSDAPPIRGMIRKVSHLVEVEEASESQAKQGPRARRAGTKGTR